MAEPFLGEIRPVGFNFAPVGWALCAGQLLPISQATALFSLIGTVYGGDGITNFRLPDLQGRVAISSGQGNGLSNYVLGEVAGTESTSLTSQHLPAHSHALGANSGAATTLVAGGNFPATPAREVYGPLTGEIMAPQSVSPAGGSQQHANIMPYLTINYIIALQGVFPSRN